MELAIGNLLDLTAKNGTTYRWQNFWIKEDVGAYSFIPYGFSGLTTNRQGDNIDATLVFPNNELSRQWAVSASKEKWLAEVKVLLFNPTDKTDQTVLHTYIGQVLGGLGLQLLDPHAIFIDAPERLPAITSDSL